MSRGVVYVAYGDQARVQVQLSAKTLVQHNPTLEFRVITDESFTRAPGFPSMRCIYHEDTDPGARQVKLAVDKLSPFDLTMYLDADTRVRGDLSAPFRVLEAGWEMAITPCRHQGDEAHRHIGVTERAATFEELGMDVTALQGGVIYLRKCEAVHRFYAAWRDEWQRWRDQDQGALLRALMHNPVRLFLLGRDYNAPDGRLIQHFYSYARRDGLRNHIPELLRSQVRA